MPCARRIAMPRTDAAPYYWLVKLLRSHDWTIRHELLLQVAGSMNHRQAGRMWGSVISSMGPDELLWGLDTSAMASARIAIVLRNKAKKQLTMHDVFNKRKNR